MKGKLNYNLKKAENSPNRASINNELLAFHDFDFVGPNWQKNIYNIF